MAESYKRLGAIAPADDKEYLLYTTPAGTQSLVSNITVANRSSSLATFDINVYETGVTQQSDLDDVAGNGTFVAVASNTAAVDGSTDGITWTAGTLTSSVAWRNVTYGEDLQPYSSPSLNNLYKTSEISANETLILEPGIALSASASIVAKDNSGGNLTISTYGVELS